MLTRKWPDTEDDLAIREKDGASLVIRHVSKAYRTGGQRVEALTDVSLTIPPGIFGLLGPNGAGKSTLMTILATLQVPDGGTIRLGDIDALADPQAMRTALGYLPQDFGVYPGVSGRRMLHYLARLKGIDDRAVRTRVVCQLLELVNLDRDQDRAADTYSGGMRQRLGVAQALLGSPALLIVDEPTAGLDPAERNRLHGILAEVSARTAILLSTHIVEDIANLCGRVAILDQGRMLAEDEPDHLTAALTGRLWQALLDKTDVARWQRAGKMVSVRMRRGRHLLVLESVECPGEPFELKPPDLEDVYFLAVPQSIG